MGTWGDDHFPANVKNDTKDLTLVVVDGIGGSLFRVKPGEDSSDYCKSVDAFGAYLAMSPMLLQWENARSSWWKVSDGIGCVVSPEPGLQLIPGLLFRLKVVKSSAANAIFGSVRPADPNAAPDWFGATPEKVNAALRLGRG